MKPHIRKLKWSSLWECCAVVDGYGMSPCEAYYNYRRHIHK